MKWEGESVFFAKPAMSPRISPVLLVKIVLAGAGRVEQVKLVDLADEFDDPPVGDPVVDVIGILPVIDDALVAQDIEMLGDIGVGGIEPGHQVAHGNLLVL